MSEQYTVRQGDCLSSIAFEKGFFPDSIWNDPDNASLKKERSDSQCLLPGDVLVIPDKKEKEESHAAEHCHRFRRKGVPEMLRVRLTVLREPRAGEDYRLDIDGILSEGRTDSEGWIKAAIPPNAQTAKVYLGSDPEPVEFQLGRLDPIEEVSGVKGRLRNLGYYFGEVDDLDDGELEGALLKFQTAHDLELTGERNKTTLSALTEACGEDA
jgi:N-acetylmuramoyl-L-alanine amidase